MKTIDEAKLESDVGYRFQYLTEFMGFGEVDIAAIHGAAPAVAPLVPALVDAVYDKLANYSATWRHFLPKQSGYDGAVPLELEELRPDHPQIAFRKQHLARYLAALVTKPYDGKMVEYLDMVGKMHTDKAGSKEIAVPLVADERADGVCGRCIRGDDPRLGFAAGGGSRDAAGFQQAPLVAERPDRPPLRHPVTHYNSAGILPVQVLIADESRVAGTTGRSE